MCASPEAYCHPPSLERQAGYDVFETQRHRLDIELIGLRRSRRGKVHRARTEEPRPDRLARQAEKLRIAERPLERDAPAVHADAKRRAVAEQGVGGIAAVRRRLEERPGLDPGHILEPRNDFGRIGLASGRR